MFVFPDPVRKAYEALPQPLVIEQFIDEKYDDVFMQNRFIEWHPIEWKHPDA